MGPVSITRPPVEIPFWAWFLFGAVVCASLAVDLMAHRGGRSLGRNHAIVWSAAWIAVAAFFGVWLGLQFGRESALEFATAYLIEKSLSIDNVFVFIVLFARLRIPPSEQHRVLFWGIAGALVSRAVFIASGTALLARWHGAVYVLGAFLIYTGIKTARIQPAGGGEGRLLPFLRRHLPLTPQLHGHRFLVKNKGRLVATPLLLVLLVIEATDILFAIDSVPAVLAVSKEPFIVYSSNIFAILGLRALYLVLAPLLHDLKYLHFALAGILVFAGVKMVGADYFHVPHLVSLVAIATALLAAIVPSVVARRRSTELPSA
jgi:tellurite resistance protein TerC